MRSSPEDQTPTMAASNMLKSKIRGCLLGGLIGDCLGAPFEGESPVGRVVLKNYFTKLLIENDSRGMYVTTV